MTPAWMAQAICASTDPDLFFAEDGRRDLTQVAKRICGGCPVRRDCLEYALPRADLFGVWGATTDRERKTMRNRRSAS